MSHVSRRLSGPLEGALAGGGDPATSPLYVFGPFLKYLAAAGVGSVTFGASIWLAVLTVACVSAMYRLVMTWVTDGSGGSGLSEEEFGPWAVKINSSITVVEYTLTFLVSIAALVTFVSDRLPALETRVVGLQLRTLVAIALTVVTGFAVNRGPRVAARAFGPATAAVLILLWVMMIATVWKLGLRLPSLHLEAFTRPNLGLTLGGYARILALMTGVEIFANLVAAYEGPARERSRKAFGSLVIIMGTTSITMLVVGPAIYDLASPLDPDVSVFTQTMDRLLPAPLAYLGTLIGIAVLLSAAAASAQGIQNLASGLRYRQYIPAWLGQKNRFDVADTVVWLQVAVCALCFLLFGTTEDTYLALYAAGVFILLSLTSWAAVKRIGRELGREWTIGGVLGWAGTVTAGLLTTGATAIIFEDRFREGAWAYLLLVPVLYAAFTWTRHRLGEPSPVQDRIGLLISSSYLSPLTSQSLYSGATFHNVLVPLDGSPDAERALAVAEALARSYDSEITLLSVLESGNDSAADARDIQNYLDEIAERTRAAGHVVHVDLGAGEPAERIGDVARSGRVDVVVMTTHGRKRWQRRLVSSVTSEVIYQTTPPLIVLRPTEDWHSTRTRFSRLLVALDGSDTAEQALPYTQELATRFGSRVLLLTVREGGDSDELTEQLHRYLARVRGELESKGIAVEALFETSAPAESILRVAETKQADLIILVSHGRGGIARQDYVKLGSVADRVIRGTSCPVFLISALPPTSSALDKTALVSASLSA